MSEIQKIFQNFQKKNKVRIIFRKSGKQKNIQKINKKSKSQEIKDKKSKLFQKTRKRFENMICYLNNDLDVIFD